MNHRNLYPAMLALIVPLATFSAATPRQSSSAPSVADAARNARELKAKDQSKPTKVYTDDDLASLKGAISVVGPAPAAPATNPDGTPAPGAAAAAKPAGTASASGFPDGKDEAGWRGLFTQAYKNLSDDARELDILQRELNLAQQQYYSDPNLALREQNSRNDLDTYQKKIDDKKEKVAKDKQAINDLEDALRRAGGDSSWAQDTTSLPVPAQPPSDGKPATP